MIRAGARAGTIYDLLAPPLILVTPFIDFTQHNGYGYAAPEFWICVAGLAAIGLLSGLIMALGGTWLRVLGTAGLLTLFVDLQFDWFDSLPHLWVPVGLLGAILLCWLTRKHLSRVVTAMFAAMLAPTLALYVLGGEPTSSNIARMRAGVDPAPAKWPADDRAHHLGRAHGHRGHTGRPGWPRDQGPDKVLLPISRVPPVWPCV